MQSAYCSTSGLAKAVDKHARTTAMHKTVSCFTNCFHFTNIPLFHILMLGAKGFGPHDTRIAVRYAFLQSSILPEAEHLF